MALTQVGAVAPATGELSRGVQREPLAVDRQRDRLGDERRLAPLRGDPARDRVVLGQVQADVGTARGSRGARCPGAPCRRTRPSSARQRARASRAEAVAKYTRWANRASSWSRTSRSVHCASVCQHATVSSPAERFSAIVSAKPRLMTSGASSTFSATATPARPRNEILLARERRVEHPDQQLHQHGGVAGAHRAERALDDEHLPAGDHAIEVDPSASR